MVDDKRRGWHWDPFWGLMRDEVPVGFISGMAALAFVFFYFYVILE